MRLLAEEGLGADVSTLGELGFAQAAGVPPERLVVHGNNKSDEELRAAADAGAAYVVLDSVEELERARAAGVERMLARVTPGIEAETHEAIRTGHVGSKFGMSPDEAPGSATRWSGLTSTSAPSCSRHAGARRRSRGQPVSTSTRAAGRRRSSTWAAASAFPTHPTKLRSPSPELVGVLVDGLENEARMILEPGPLARRAGRSDALPGRIGQALRWTSLGRGRRRDVDNPRPQLYGARYTAVIANRVGEEARPAHSESPASTANRAMS